LSVEVAFIGLGRMGAPMALRLVGAGHRVRGHDLVGHELEGVLVAASAADAAAGADAVVLMLPTSADVHWVVVEDGVLEAMDSRATLIDMSSSDPMATRELAEAAGARGIDLVDAPVSGGVPRAIDGTLTIMAGGRDAALERVRPLLDAMGSRVLHVGAAGAGHALKALNNLLSAAHLLATCEAVAIGRRFGLDPKLMVEAINTSSGASVSTAVKLPNYILTETFDSGFGLALMVKDVGIAVALGEELGIPGALAERTLELWRQAAEALPANADHTEIARWVDARY
jgi:3-hydroxyisobutyrate dehydrogenase